MESVLIGEASKFFMIADFRPVFLAYPMTLYENGYHEQLHRPQNMTSEIVRVAQIRVEKFLQRQFSYVSLQILVEFSN